MDSERERCDGSCSEIPDGFSFGSEDCDGGTAGQSPRQPLDFLVLHSLVQDGALPAGYDREFMSLEPIVKAAARRENERAITITNVTAALWLDKFEKERNSHYHADGIFDSTGFRKPEAARCGPESVDTSRSCSFHQEENSAAHNLAGNRLSEAGRTSQWLRLRTMNSQSAEGGASRRLQELKRQAE